jgi:hypothetical protein
MKKAKHLKRPKFPGHLNLAKGGAVVQRFANAGPVAALPENTIAGPSTGGVNTTAATGAGQTGLVGTIGDTLGLQNNFQGQAANITPGTNVGQLNAAYQGVQGALDQQGQIANQLMPQVGGAVGNQNMLADQYAAMTRGEGPNPAQMQLNQATAANVANQAALMAGQRGAGANAGLMARQAAMQGAATQQQAAGQAATLGAQQQIAAQQNLAGLANNQVIQAGNAAGAYGTAQQNEQNILQNANTSLNNAAVGMQSNLNNVNSQSAIANQNMNSNIVKGIGGALSNVPIIGDMFAQGGEIAPNPLVGNQPPPSDNWVAPQFAQASASSGPVVPGTPQAAETKGPFGGDDKKASGPMGGVESLMGGGAGDTGGLASLAMMAAAHGGKIAKGPHKSHVANFMAGGATEDVKALVSPKEVYLEPDQVHKVLHEGADPMKIGYRFPGTDKVKGKDSYKNDVIPTTLRSGGAVIPVHITTHKDASEKSRKFVKRIMARHMKKPAGAK